MCGVRERKRDCGFVSLVVGCRFVFVVRIERNARTQMALYMYWIRSQIAMKVGCPGCLWYVLCGEMFKCVQCFVLLFIFKCV